MLHLQTNQLIPWHAEGCAIQLIQQTSQRLKARGTTHRETLRILCIGVWSNLKGLVFRELLVTWGCRLVLPRKPGLP